MRLAILTNQFPATVSTFFARDLRALIEAGVDVEVFAIYPRDDSLWQFVPHILDEKILPREKVHHITIGQSLLKGFPTFISNAPWLIKESLRISLESIRYGLKPLAYSLYIVPKALAWAAEMDRFDQILAYWGNYAATCAYLASGLSKKRVPYSIFLHAGTDLYRDRIFLKTKLLQAKTIVTCSDFNQGYILEQYPDQADVLREKIHVYHHGLDFSELPFTETGRVSNRILAVGRLADKKGFDYVIKSGAELVRRGVNVEVELIGDGPEAENLRALAQDLNIADRVVFRGWQPFDQVRDAMLRATVLVHPSTGLGDGVPNVIKEAMAVGMPVVSTRVAGIPEALDHGRAGMLVSPNDVNEVADAIQVLLQNPAKRMEIAQAAQQHVRKKYDLWRNGQLLVDRLTQAAAPERQAEVFRPST
ncbi:MAG TPA: glycosyltransferase [Anaerolineaceae bacterium]|nr:glycosyltransferase [Anaerolineaceae bacterium]